MEVLTAEELYKLMDDELANYLGWTLQLNLNHAELEAAEKEAKSLLAPLVEAKNAEDRARRETVWLHGQGQYELTDAELDAFIRPIIAELKVQTDEAVERLCTLYGITRLRAAESTAISKEE